ncbi:MAG: 6-carboxytetrahydropterin synthase QueD [Candidatus Omnitrophica bacterium]|nr:6-carboxytetrahydropterin synthase QueD [Candidatus Omnitrophota bacterium]MCM8768496.1 6-carboxytetrahydropterin synthase QueD [Candidatus Omnitrophota bacterium]
MYEIMVEDEFSAAHFLRGYRGKCEKVHGHNWKVTVVVSGKEIDKRGLLLDFHDLRKELSQVLERLDHKDLNSLPFFKKRNPSSENIAFYIFWRLEKRLARKNISLARVTVWENCRQSATYFSSGGGYGSL